MAVSRPDGLPLHEGAFDYAQTDVPIFTAVYMLRWPRSTMKTRTSRSTRYQLTGAFHLE